MNKRKASVATPSSEGAPKKIKLLVCTPALAILHGRGHARGIAVWR